MTKSKQAGEHAAFGLNMEYWDRMGEKEHQLYRDIRPLRSSAYAVHNPISSTERTLAALADDAASAGGVLDLCPDFQRGHVWSQEKQIGFMESVLRGVAPMVIRFNCPAWDRLTKVECDGLNPHDILCVDGLQRLTAMRDFMAGKFKVFGKYEVSDLDGTPFAMNNTQFMWVLEMFTISSRADLLQFYLDLNRGGVVHSPEELGRVDGLLAQARGESAAPNGKALAPRPRAKGK